MTPQRRAFYRFHATLMEPWDGPALIAFTDGSVIGAVLDRNGLRPGRYWVTSDGLVVLASEVGVLDIDPATVIRKGRLQPGRIFLADTAAGRIVEDEEVKAALAAEHPTRTGCTPACPPRRPARPRRGRLPAAADLLTPAADARVHRGGTAGHPGPDGPDRGGADRVDGHRHAGRRAVRPAAAGVRLLHPAVRPGDQPAAGRDPGGARHLARHDHRPGAEPAGTGPGVLPPDRAAVPGAQRQGPGQDRAHQRRRQPARPRLARGRRPVRPARRRRRACVPGWPRSAPRSPPRSPAAPASSSCPTAAEQPPSLPWCRSRRCCSPGRCIIT